MFPPELPAITNKPLYVYRVFVKLFSFFIFGLGTVILITIIFPAMRLIFHPKERFKKYGRRLISLFLRFFVAIMHFLGAIDLEVDNRKNFQNLSSKIVIANHPSLLDVVMLISLIPNADCIVNAALNQHIVRGIIQQLYIPNSLDFDNFLQACNNSLVQGNCLIIFPEGTRTPRSGKVILKKGAARIALYSGCNIVPVLISGTDKYGLGKKEPWTGYNPQERYVYRLNIGKEINPEKYIDLPTPKAVQTLTREMFAVLFPGKEINEEKEEN